MIYLFEDRQERKNQLLKKDIDSDKFKEEIFEHTTNDLKEFLQQFKYPKAVLFHKSYNTGEHAIDDIKNQFTGIGAKFVLFSGGLENNYIGDNISVNSGTMYNNLSLFVEKYEGTGEIKIPILLYGKNYLRNELLGMQYLIWNVIVEIQEKMINQDAINEISNIVNDFLTSDELKADKEKLNMWLKKKSELNVDTLKEQIIKFVSKYEEFNF